MTSDTEIKMKEISNQITDLKLEYERLRGDYIRELQDKLGKLVGLSFKSKNGTYYFRIIDIPIVEYNKTYTSFNEYRLPALIYYSDPTDHGDVGRLGIQEIYSEAAHAENPINFIRSEYTEIPAEEFDAKLEKAFDEIRSLGKRGDV